MPPRFLSACASLLSLLVLAVASRELWQHRFMPAEGQLPLVLGYTPEGVATIVGGQVGLPAKRGDVMEMEAAKPPPQVSYQWFTEPVSPYAYISVDASATGVVQGHYDWEVARITVEWHDRNGARLPDYLPVWGGKGTIPSKFREVIMPMSRHGGLPRIVVENLGSAGHMTVKSLTVQPVVARPWFRWAAAGLMIAWFVAVYRMLRTWIAPGVSGWRIASASAVCMAFVWFSSFPGPWMPLQPLQERFAITPLTPPDAPRPELPPAPDSAPSAAPATPPPPPPVEPPKPRELPTFPAEVKGPPEILTGATLRTLVTHLPSLKIWLHLAAFAGLAAGLAFLTGTRRAAYVAGGLGFVSEFCEWAFGYGVDWGDAGDLLMDAVAVLVGMMIWKYGSRWLARRWGLRPGRRRAQDTGS